MVRHFSLLFLFILSFHFSNAQTYIGGHFNPAISGAITSATAPAGSGLTVGDYTDSIRSIQNTIFTPAFGIHVSHRMKRFDEIYVGLRYQITGWGRKRVNLQFPDSLHRDVGKIQALQPPGDVQYRYRFVNISIPVYYMKTLKFNEMPTGMSLAFYGGGALNAVISQKSSMETIGFTAFGEKNFDLPSEQFDLLPINISLEGGFRMRQDLGDGYHFSAMPGFAFMPIPASNATERYFMYRFQMGLGISKAF